MAEINTQKMRVLYLMNNANIFGGTPKKTIDLLNYFKKFGSIYFYAKNDEFKQYLKQFEITQANVLAGNHGWNIYKHLKNLIAHVDENKIQVIHAQFSMGELLSVLVKLFRPNIKVVVSFVLPFSPKGYKRIISNIIYPFVDGFIFVSNYVKTEKLKQFPKIDYKRNKVIYNGTKKREVKNKIKDHENTCLLDIAGLTNWKNIDVLVSAMNILLNERMRTNIKLHIAGDGPEKKRLQILIDKLGLSENIKLLGYQSNIGDLLYWSDIFVHPAYAEAFGIAIPEAMLANKPIIVANAGALPELIDNNINGLVVDPYSPNDWADAIDLIIINKEIANQFANSAYDKASNEFTSGKFTKNYESFYIDCLNN
jgi:glycosyltransferase involved in cell wall biosynthesis